MPALFAGLLGGKAIYTGALKAKKLYVGTVQIWADALGTKLFGDNFQRAVTSDISSGTAWVDRAYGGSGVYGIVAGGYITPGTNSERKMNTYYLQQVIPSQDQWATVDVATLPEADRGGIGVCLRNDGSRTCSLIFYLDTVEVRQGSTNSTSNGTVVATGPLPRTLRLGDKIGGTVVGPNATATVVCYLNGEPVLTIPSGNVGTSGDYAGVSITNQPGGVTNFECGTVP